MRLLNDLRRSVTGHAGLSTGVDRDDGAVNMVEDVVGGVPQQPLDEQLALSRLG